LAAKSSDALIQFKLDSLNAYFKESGQKKLWMLQQNIRDANDPYNIDSKYSGKVEALTQRYGKTASVCLYPDELQEDFGVEPEAMSMLSADDDIRRQAGQTLLQMAAQMPGVVDPHYAARFFAGTIRGVDPDQAVPPPQPPAPIPPKMNVAIAVKWGELPYQAQHTLLTEAGVPDSPELQEELMLSEKMTGIMKADAAGTAADGLLSKAPSDQMAEQQAQELQSSEADKSNAQTIPRSYRILKTQELSVRCSCRLRCFEVPVPAVPHLIGWAF